MASVARRSSKRRKLAHLNVHFRSGSEEWYTPPKLITLARDVLGVIDLDPASCEVANQSIQANQFYSIDDDGLALPWFGRVWLNPPYGKTIGEWVEKLCFEYETGHITAALALLPARSGSAWWRRVSRYPMCFLHGRIRFVGAEKNAPFPSVVVYLGAEPNRFALSFAKSGAIMSPLML